METPVHILILSLLQPIKNRGLLRLLGNLISQKTILEILIIWILLIIGFLLASCTNETVQVFQTETSVSTTTLVVPTNTITPTLAPTFTLTFNPTSTLTPTITTSAITYSNPQNYQVTFKSKGTNPNFRITRILVYLPIPIEWDGQQHLKIEEISPEPAAQIVDPTYGNGLVYWDSPDVLPIGEISYFTIRFAFTAYETKTNIQPENVQPYDTDSELYNLYTHTERFIEMNDPVIREMADEAAGSETNPYLLAKRFYDYILDNFSYKLFGEGLLGAKEFCIRGRGECGDYSALFIALCRLKGIPARPVVGYWAISGLEQTHVWAEFYLEGIGWIPVDLSVAEQSVANRNYYFGNLDNQRVILHKGFNIPLEGAPDNYIAPLIQLPQYWFWGSGGDANTVQIESSEWNVSTH